MGALRDNKILIHNIYKRIKSKGIMSVNLGGKSNRIKWRLKSSYNVMAMKYEVYNLTAKFFLNECEIRESGDIVSIGLDVSNPNACKFELQEGKYNLRDIIQLRLFTVDVAANNTVWYTYFHGDMNDMASFFQGFNIHTIEELKDFLGDTIDTKTWRSLCTSRRISESVVRDLLKSIEGSPYYRLLDRFTDDMLEELTKFFRKLVVPKSTVGFNKKANFGDTFLPIVSFDFSKSGKVKYMSLGGYIEETDLGTMNVDDVTRAYISTKLLSLSFKEEVIQSNQYSLTISK